MATVKGQVTLRGRFPAGSRVRLVKVKDESVLRSEGGKVVDSGTVDEDGSVQFSKDVEVGGRYFIVGHVDGRPVEVRARGNKADDESSVLSQAPVGTERVRLSDGSWADEAPERVDTPPFLLGPDVGQHQVPEGTAQRSDTPRGKGTPVDLDAPGEPGPYLSQKDVPDGTWQRSDTEHGIATPIPDVEPTRQEDAPEGLLQRSATPYGVTTPIPAGDAVEAQRTKESALGRSTHGEPGKVAGRPQDTRSAKGQAKPKAKKAGTRKAAAKPSQRAKKDPGRNPGGPGTGNATVAPKSARSRKK